MPDDTTAALQALMQQVTKLTETVTDQQKRMDDLHKHNSRLLDKVMDTKRENTVQTPPKKTIVDIADEEIHERKMRAANLEKGPDGNWYPQGVRPAHSLTREDARDPAKYRAAKEAAQKAGVTLTVIDDGNGDPTRQPRAQVANTRTTVIKDDDTKRAYIRKDIFGTPEFQEQYKQLRANGYTPVSWAQTDDLPPHMQTKHRMMENAANASDS